jgi:peptidoglycan/LPS O-acetylase OafA/YrhL
MMALGALVCGGALLAYRRASERGRPVAFAAAAVPFALLAIPVALAPANPVHGHLPAALVATVRAVVVVGQLLLWGTLAAAHAWLVGRVGETAATLESGPAAERVQAAD